MQNLGLRVCGTSCHVIIVIRMSCHYLSFVKFMLQQSTPSHVKQTILYPCCSLSCEELRTKQSLLGCAPQHLVAQSGLPKKQGTSEMHPADRGSFTLSMSPPHPHPPGPGRAPLISWTPHTLLALWLHPTLGHAMAAQHILIQWHQGPGIAGTLATP